LLNNYQSLRLEYSFNYKDCVILVSPLGEHASVKNKKTSKKTLDLLNVLGYSNVTTDS